MRRATYRVPPADVAGRAARLVLDVARRQAREKFWMMNPAIE